VSDIERALRSEADARDVVYQCQAEIERLQAENEWLRRQLASVGRNQANIRYLSGRQVRQSGDIFGAQRIVALREYDSAEHQTGDL
jgi:hypothetical protein